MYGLLFTKPDVREVTKPGENTKIRGARGGRKSTSEYYVTIYSEGILFQGKVRRLCSGGRNVGRLGRFARNPPD